MSNSEPGFLQEYMDDDRKSDEFGDTDKEEKVKNLINYQNFEDEGQRWEYTIKIKKMSLVKKIYQDMIQ